MVFENYRKNISKAKYKFQEAQVCVTKEKDIFQMLNSLNILSEVSTEV